MRHFLVCLITCITIVTCSLSPGYALDITLAWDANSETNLAGYKLYYGTKAGGPYNGSGSSEGASPIVVPLTSLTNPSSPEFTIHGLADGSYYFVATAYNTEGLESGYSNEASTEGSTTPGPTNSAPILSSLEVNGASGSTTIYTNEADRMVSIRIVASDDSLVSQYLILDGNSNPNSGTFIAIPGGARQNPIFTVSDFVLNNSDGNHTVYAWVKDDQGLLSSAASKTNVILDRVAPTVALSYSAASPYKAGDAVTITANFTDSSPISGTPMISINYAGTGSDISNASMTQASNKQWRYVMAVPSGNDGTATVTIAAADAAGNVLGSITGGTFVVDNTGPAVVGFPVINYTESSITITYSESNMQNAALASSYSLNNGLMLSGNGVDTSGTGKVFKLPLTPATLQRYLIYALQIGSAVKDASGNALSSSAVRVNDEDNDGMADDWEIKWFGSITAKNGSSDSDGDGLSDGSEYSYARSSPAWGTDRWTLSPLSRDSDGDGIPDQYEVTFGLNPVSSADRNLDLDGDGWSNYQEYLSSSAANDPKAHPQGSIEIVEVIPLDDAGIPPDTSRIPNNTPVSVRLESTNGIEISDPQAVSLSINDGQRTYTRSASDKNASGQALVRLFPVETNGDLAYSLWISYYRSNETTIPGVYPYGATVEVTIQAADVKGVSLQPSFFIFRIESEETARWAEENAPTTVVLKDTPTAGKTTLAVEGGALDGAGITYDSSLLQELGFEPEFGPLDEVPQAPGLGVPLNLLPHAVFPRPVTLTIPCRGYKEVRTLSVYYYDGREWWLGCDAAGNVTPEGEGWMVPGSRVNHEGDQNGPAYIQIQVYHFSAAAAGESAGAASVSASPSGSSSGSGCFISTLWN